MLKNRKLKVGLILLLLFYCLLPFTKTQAPVNVGILHSIESFKPNIDGVIDSVEWQNAVPKIVTLYLWNDPSIQREVTLLSMFDDNSILYFGFIIPNSGVTDLSLDIIFGINVSEPLLYYQDWDLLSCDGFNTKAYETKSDKSSDFTTTDSLQITDVPIEQYFLGSGHDLKQFDTVFNTTFDKYTIANIPYAVHDIDVGGTTDSMCRWTSNSTHNIVEIAMPFDTGDRIGFDPELDYGDSIDFTFIVSGGDTYVQGRCTDKDYDYCVLKIEKLQTPVLDEISPLIDNDGNISLNWNDVLDATSYNVYRDTSTISDVSSLTPIATTTDSDYNDTGLFIATTYYYAITAENSYSVSNLSNIEQVNVLITTSETSVSIIITLINLFGVCLGVFVIKSRRN